MKKDFDHIAKKYDADFTYSEIGKLQRNSVYKYMDSLFQKEDNKVNNILELNCGTGQDAIWFAKKGHTVLAIDISSEMINVGKQKAKKIENLKFKQLDINNLKFKIQNSKFDLIFSNFGGLNCLSKKELKTFFESASKLLNKNGRLILVIMPKNTLWERLYFILKGRVKTAFRRNTNKPINVNVEGKEVKTWYFNPTEIRTLVKAYFKVSNTKPIGLFIPPSYLENYFVRHKRLLRTLDLLEKKIGKFGFLSRFSDHYIIELEFKN